MKRPVRAGQILPFLAALSVCAASSSSVSAGWILYATSGNQYTQINPTLATSSVGALDENLYAIDINTADLNYQIPVRNNVDAQLAANGWSGPFFGENYRDNEGLGYNPLTGELYHFNGTIGFDAPPSPYSYDTRLIEAYDPLDGFSRRDIVNAADRQSGRSATQSHGAGEPELSRAWAIRGDERRHLGPAAQPVSGRRDETIGALNPATGQTTILNAGAPSSPSTRDSPGTLTVRGTTACSAWNGRSTATKARNSGSSARSTAPGSPNR
ncbi:MAG: hypothetical protein R3C10_17345 [Pirellulales bacterium]